MLKFEAKIYLSGQEYGKNDYQIRYTREQSACGRGDHLTRVGINAHNLFVVCFILYFEFQNCNHRNNTKCYKL